MRGMMDGWHGDEPEIEAREAFLRQEYEDEHADDWKYSEERFDETIRLETVRRN